MELTNTMVYNLFTTEADGRSVVDTLLNTRMAALDLLRLRKSITTLQEQFQVIEQKRNELIEKLGTENDKGVKSVNDPENLNTFFAEFNDVLAEKREYDLKKLSFEAFCKFELTNNECNACSFLFDIEAE